MAPGIAAITVKNGVNYDAPDGQDVKLCFIITAPKTKKPLPENVEEKKGKH